MVASQADYGACLLQLGELHFLFTWQIAPFSPTSISVLPQIPAAPLPPPPRLVGAGTRIPSLPQVSADL